MAVPGSSNGLQQPFSRAIGVSVLIFGRVFVPEAEIMTVESGTRATETQRHEQFKEEHLAMEWFRLNGRLLDWIELQMAQHNLRKRGAI